MHDAASRRLIVRSAVAGALITLVVSALPFVPFVVRSAGAHVAINTAATVISTVAAVLLFQRFRRTGLSRDLLVVAALGTLAAASLLLSVIPAVAGHGFGPVSTWAVLASRLLGAALLAGACFAPPTRLSRPSRATWWTLGATSAAVGLFALVALTLSSHLPAAVDSGLRSADSGRPHVEGHPLLLAGQLVGMLLFVAAGIGFARRAERGRDEFMTWLAAGAIMAAFARLNYFVSPSQYTEFLCTGDLFNLAFYLLLLVGAVREIEVYHRGSAALAVLEERRRIAREMHDGLTQELAFIAGRVRTLRREAQGIVGLDQLSSAAERALDDSRAAIAALTRPLDEPLAAALARNATDVAERLGARAEVNVEAGVEVSPVTREAFVRIVREAITNAVRHGRADRIELALSRGTGITLTVADDGCGFDADARSRRPAAGFGLLSMSERAEALGGAMRVISAPGAGTTIEVVIPCPPR